MPPLSGIPNNDGPVHLLLVAPSKTGKSTYAAEAAIDGMTLVYIDSDNGLSALRAAITRAKAPEAASRVHYFGTTKPKGFTQLFLKSTVKSPLRWVPSLDKLWSKSLDLPDDEPVWVIMASEIPAHIVLCIDSWTALAQDALQQLRPDQAAPLTDGVSQAIYGEAKAGVDYISNMLQQYPGHVLVQAHDMRFEVYDKPTNTTGKDMKQAVMTLVETLEVPISTSGPAGAALGKRFNHIGWLAVNNLGVVEIDFTRKAKRIGGGPPNRKARTSELGFKQLVVESGGAITGDDRVSDWFTELTHGELKGGK